MSPELIALIDEFNTALIDVSQLIDRNDGWGYESQADVMMRNNPLPKWLGPNEDYTSGRVHAEWMSGCNEDALDETRPLWQRSRYNNNNKFRLAMRRTYAAAKDVADYKDGLLFWKLSQS